MSVAGVLMSFVGGGVVETVGVSHCCGADVVSVAGVGLFSISLSFSRYQSNCAKYPLRLFICSPFAIFSRNVAAFLEI